MARGQGMSISDSTSSISPQPEFDATDVAVTDTGTQGATSIDYGSDQLKALGDQFADIADGSKTLGYNPSVEDEQARSFQGLLKDLNYYSGTLDGLYGRGTETAVASFQRDQGLTPTGVVDAETIKKMDDALQLGDKMTSGPVQDTIMFLGMGQYARHEVSDLRSHGVNVTAALDTGHDEDMADKIEVGGELYDLNTEAGVDGFLGSIGVSGEKAAELKEILQADNGWGAEDSRDEIAQVIHAFARAERGDINMDRMILSGHSVGTSMWGDENGDFSFDTLEAIAGAFPKASANMEDLMIAGCYAGTERNVDRFRDMFPKLKSFWAYGKSAPGTWTGAKIHNAIWEKETRGDNWAGVDRLDADGTRKGENVVVWNAEDGFQPDVAPRPISEVQAELADMQPTYDSFFSGEQDVTDTQTGPLREFYSNVQNLLGNPELPAGDRAQLEQVRDQNIRLIFFDSLIKGKFQSNYADQISAGYQAVGLPAPNFAELSRAGRRARQRRAVRERDQRYEPAAAGRREPPARPGGGAGQPARQPHPDHLGLAPLATTRHSRDPRRPRAGGGLLVPFLQAPTSRVSRTHSLRLAPRSFRR
jgi:hypothetical protein